MTGDRLAARLGIAFTALFLFTFASVLGATLYLTARWAETALDDHLRSVADAAASRLDDGGDRQVVADQVASAAQFVEFRDLEWNVTASADVLGGRTIPVSLSEARAGGDRFQTTTMTRSRVRVLSRPLVDAEDRRIGYIVVASPMPGVGPMVGELLWLLAAAGAVGFLLTTAGTWLLSRWVARPLDELSNEVEATIASGLRRNVTVPGGGSVEVRKLGDAIHVLVARQREEMERERAFFADSSHVLRTPLTVLRGNLELLAEGGSEEERRDSWNRARAALDSMSRTLSGLMLLGRDEASGRRDRRIVDLSALLRSLLDDLRVATPQLDVVGQLAPGLEVSGDPHQLRELLVAVLENAAIYTPSGGKVDVRLFSDHPERVVIEVRDNGIGLTDEEARRATERFFRGFQARRLFPSGSGLGLAIASRLAELHDGTLALAPGPEGGAICRIELPRAELDL